MIFSTRADRRCWWLLVLFLLTLYAFTASGRVTSGDGEAMYLTTQALITRRQLSITPRPETAIGRHGRAYSKYGVGQSAAQAPFFVLGHLVRKAAHLPDDKAERFTTSFTNPTITALLVGVLWLVLHDLGAGRTAATAGALIFGAGTLAWPYARADFSEPLQGLTLLAAFWALIRWRRSANPWWMVLAGLAAGFSVITKAASAILLAPLALYFAYAVWRHLRGGRAHVVLLGVVAGAIPFGACGLFQAALNLYRFGKVTEFGYGSEPATGFTTPLLTGIQYLLLSSGKGLFWYAAPVLVGLPGLIWLARRYWPEACAAGLIFLAELTYYGRWWAWHGDWCWGPRYMVVTIPFVMLGWGPLLASWRTVTLPVRALAIAAVTAGLAAAILGAAIDYGNYYSVVADQIGRGVDVRDARLNPPFSPLLGHAWLAKASAYDALVGFLRSGGGAHPGAWDPATNPFLDQYPWAAARPDLVPEAPERAVGFAPWYAALADRSAFILYWSGMVAVWLVLALLSLGRRLWRAAFVAAAPEARPALAATPRELDLVTA